MIVETARGVEFGSVVLGPERGGGGQDHAASEVGDPARHGGGCRERKRRTGEKEKEAFGICLEKIRKHGLEMKLIDAEYTFDNNKVLYSTLPRTGGSTSGSW